MRASVRRRRTRLGGKEEAGRAENAEDPAEWIGGVPVKPGGTVGQAPQAADEPLDEDDEEEEDDDEEDAVAELDEPEEDVDEEDDFASDPVEDDDPEPDAFAAAGAGVLLDEEPRLSFR